MEQLFRIHKKEKIIDKNVLLHYFNDNIDEFINFTTRNNELSEIDNFAEFEMIERLTDEQATDIIMQKFKINDTKQLEKYFKNMSKEELKQKILEIKKIKGTNITQIARITRKTRRIIEGIWNKI